MSTEPAGSEVNGTRSSFESDRLSSPSPTKELNGITHLVDVGKDESDMDPIQKLQSELERTKEEKEALASQYRTLLSKLTTMRTTLGNKLKQDAVRSFPHSVTPKHCITRLVIGRTRPSGAACTAVDSTE